MADGDRVAVLVGITGPKEILLQISVNDVAKAWIKLDPENARNIADNLQQLADMSEK